MKNKMICAITGRNIVQIGNGQSETYYKNINIKKAIAENMTELIEAGVTDFMCNAEYGFPLWACEILLALQKVRIQQGLSVFRLHIVMPHETQADDYSDEVHERFYEVHAKADAVLVLYRQYREDCYRNCERFMIDHCDVLFTDDEDAFAAQYAEIHGKSFVICGELERI